MSVPAWMLLDPNNVTVGDPNVDDSWKVCVIDGVYFGGNDYSGELGARISSIFVILIVSTGFTLFPVVVKHFKRFKVKDDVYLFAKNFGTGVIITTAFVHLLDPAYGEIGPNTCVGMTGNWAVYSWVPAIALMAVFVIFIIDVASEVYVEHRFGISHSGADIIQQAITTAGETDEHEGIHAHVHVHDPEHNPIDVNSAKVAEKTSDVYSTDASSTIAQKDFESQFAAFLILEFGVIFHSVMIGINLGAAGSEFKTLYPVLIFHQSFEGLGIGARLSAINFPEDKRWWKYVLCLMYGLTTPICIAIGLGFKSTYDGNSFNSNIIQGVLDSISAGILVYTGLVELLARDYIFNEHRTKSIKKLIFGIFTILLGAGLMALLGKWA